MGSAMKRATIGFLAVLVCGMAFEGDEYPKDYFRSPIGIPILLSGSFQELRSGHFHSGLDIKTNGKQGYRIYAAGDGQIVRIKVSPTGFGNALYIRHPNGFTTAYAHLRNFSDEIEEYVRREQYAQKSFAVDLFPAAGRFPVSKGDVIALSGNSGSSGGPHLHFEIRETASEWPVNPLLFGLDLKDTQAPRILRLKIYAIDSRSRATIRYTNGRTATVTHDRPVSVAVAGSGSRYRLSDVKEIEGAGRIGFGLETRDTHDGSASRLGLYTLTLTRDATPVFRYKAEKFSFAATRFINAHVDYEERTRTNRWVERSFLLPGNRLPSYPVVDQNGIIELQPGTTTRIAYEVADVAENTSTLSFDVKGVELNPIVEASAAEPGNRITHGQPYTFRATGIAARFDADAFYEDLDFGYDVGRADSRSFSPRHSLHDPYTPVHSSFDLTINASVPPRLRNVTVLAYENEDGKTSYSPATYRDGGVSASVRALGTYYVSADSVGPRIRPINIHNGADLSRASNIRFRISDAETGIRAYDGYVDGKWVLFSFDAKTGMLVYDFDDRVGRGSHELQVKATDGVGNTTVYEASFTR